MPRPQHSFAGALAMGVFIAAVAFVMAVVSGAVTHHSLSTNHERTSR